MYEVKTRQVPEQQVLTATRHVKQPELQTFIMEQMGALPTAIERAGAKPVSPQIVIFHGEVNADSDGPVEVCQPFEGRMEPREGTQVRIEPAHQEAFTTITLQQCEFPGILEAYDAVHAFLQREGMEPSGSPREVYFVEPDKIGPDDPFCDVAWPATPARQPAAAG